MFTIAKFIPRAMDNIGVEAIHVNGDGTRLGNQLIIVVSEDQMQIANVECFSLFGRVIPKLKIKCL